MGKFEFRPPVTSDRPLLWSAAKRKHALGVVVDAAVHLEAVGVGVEGPVRIHVRVDAEDDVGGLRNGTDVWRG
jgi:hypothetical protein